MQTVPRLYQTFQPEHYQLILSIDRKNRRFTGTVTIRGAKVTNDPLRLHAKDIDVESVTDTVGNSLSFTMGDYDQLTITGVLPAGDVELSVKFSGTITDGMHGLYPCYYEDGGIKKELLATQFESHHAREVFPCIDEPEAKATFDLTLQTESNVEVLSNMPSISSTTNQDLTVTTRFETTPRMSTYLLAFVIGDLQKITAHTKSGVEVNVWATKAQPAESLEFPLEVAVGSIEFFDDYFQVPYPLPKADHVALPDFSSGAMENWGLITYREVALLVDKNSSISTKEYVATVIAHETSHQWFGNLVTMKWWDDLWLNESFATIMEYVAIDALYPHWEVWNTFASQEAMSALRRDQLAGVQAVKCEVNHPDEISTLFDPSIVYAKGGRLLKMLKSYIGEDAFRSGLTAYFKSHAYGNTTGADLWEAFSESSGKDIGGFMKSWLDQSGFPLISVKTTDSGYELSQERFIVGGVSDDRTWPVPLFASNKDFPNLLAEKTSSFAAPHTLPLVNTGNDAHFIAEYDTAAMSLIRDSLATGAIDVIARLSFLHEASMLARGNKADTGELVALLQSFDREDREPVWGIISLVIGDLKRFVEADEVAESHLKALVNELASPLYHRLGFTQIDGESEHDVKLRATIVSLMSYADNTGVIDTALHAFRDTSDFNTLASETRPIVFGVAAKHGRDEDFNRLLSAHDSTNNPELRDDIASGLCATRQADQIATLLERLSDSKLVKPQDVFRWFIYLLRNRYAREAAWQWMVESWGWIEKTYKGDKSYDNFARYSATVFSTSVWQKRYDDFFEKRKSETSLRRAIEVGQTEIASRSEWLSRDLESVTAALAQRNS